jgi:hypothetical protein
MSRRKRTADSSLELLLDTICNTFGGVLFLAILICVLLRMASPVAELVTEPDRTTPEEMQALESQLDALVAEIETLQAAQAQQDEIAEKLIDPAQKDLFNEVSKERAERHRLLQDRLRTVAEVHKTQRSTAALLKDLEALRKNLDTTRQEIKDKRAELAQAHAERDKLALKADELLTAMQKAQARTAPLPRQRRSTKSEVGLIVRFKRLYLWNNHNSAGDPIGLNTDELEFEQRLGANILVGPKPQAGVLLEGDNAPARITARLKPFDPQRVHLAIPIWGDSFESFQTLKNTIVGLGFEYRLMPMEDDAVLTDRGGGSDTRVQ